MLPFIGASQKSETEKSIDKVRKGEIIIKARPGAMVKVEQAAHEFWFGCAIPNSLADGTMAETDKKQFPIASLTARWRKLIKNSFRRNFF